MAHLENHLQEKLEVDYEPAMFSPKIGMNETDAKSYKSLCVNI